MKRVTLVVLAFISIVIADDNINLGEVAKRFDTDETTVQACLEEAGVNTAEISTLLDKWGELKNDNANEEIKQSLTKYSLFLACILEKNGLMVETKLVVDKLMEHIEKDKDLEKMPNKAVLTECLNALNEDSQMSREDRVFGLMFCIMNSQIEGDRK